MTSNPTRIATALVALVLLAFTSACSLTRPAPVRDSFLLDPAWPPPVAKSQLGTLRMGTVTVAAPFRGRSFVVRDTALKFDADFYHEFFVLPGVIVTDATAQALVRAKVFAAQTPPGLVVDANWVLDGFVRSLYADGRDAVRPEAVVEITYFLSRDDGGATTPVWSRAYQRRIPFTAGTTSAYVAALNTGFSEILGELTSDLAAVPLPTN
ncbi:MAG: hypothetical protein ABI607_02540 [Betaproteobacteria bacterium]